MKRSIETHIITWRGITIEVRYEAAWLGSDGPCSTAHLEVRQSARRFRLRKPATVRILRIGKVSRRSAARSNS
ncbi:hypothetical protein [Reyranella soli]|uniref:Uncharacterized protein n=1 Tax=Reyranella soli TaxID=1230389 RepID=A0A512NNB3_9HYPH|nr:hypothetical protein [Reyranella soli]GEP60434.1 hypothetical protein RSO01_76000 [Reyranella soli]